MILVVNSSRNAIKKARAVGLLSLLFFLGCSHEPDVLEFSGATMGTRWHVTLVTLNGQKPEDLQAGIQSALDSVDSAMSTYQHDSDLSRFNRAVPGQWVGISAQTLAVTQVALRVAEQTDNAFNPAVAELVELWGFGAQEQGATIPGVEQVEAALAQTRLQRLELDASAPALRKLAPLKLDYSAIAKGYGADQAAESLERAGIGNYLVEVGGEVRCAGARADGNPWRVGIERPQLLRGEAYAAITLSNEAVATSGDYRNYREVGGQRFSHTLDPATGYPVSHPLASVSVIAPTAVLADAYATAIAVMGPVHGLVFAEALSLPVYMLVRDGAEFIAVASSEFEDYLPE